MTDQIQPAEGPRRYLEVLWRRKWFIIVALVVIPAAVVTVSLRQPTRYSATARMMAQSQSPSISVAVGTNLGLSQPNERELQTLASFAVTREIATRAAKDLGWADAPAGLMKKVTAEADPSADVINVTAEWRTPEGAADLANAFARQFLLWRQETLQKSLDDAMKVTGMTLLIIAASTTFAQALAYSGASSGMINWFMSFNLSPLGVLFVMIGIVLILGMFMDQLSMMLITLPIFIPIAKTLGFDLVWFGLLLLLVNVIVTAYWPFLAYDPLWVYAYNAKIFVMERAIGQAPPDVPPYVFDSWLLRADPADRQRLQNSAIDVLATLPVAIPGLVVGVGGRDTRPHLLGVRRERPGLRTRRPRQRHNVLRRRAIR